jgi:hypothetical protein
MIASLEQQIQVLQLQAPLAPSAPAGPEMSMRSRLQCVVGCRID